jgi:hypothetical protein
VSRAGHAPRVVPATGPRGRRAGQPQRSEERHRGHEHADHPEHRTALHDRDDREAEIGRDGQGHRHHAVARILVERVGPHEQQRADDRRDEHGVHRAAALPGPVDVVEMQPERELVERQGGPDPEQRREHVGPRWVGTVGELGGPRAEQQEDPVDLVVHVHPGQARVAERPVAAADGPGDGPDGQECHQERAQHPADERPATGGPAVPPDSTHAPRINAARLWPGPRHRSGRGTDRAGRVLVVRAVFQVALYAPAKLVRSATRTPCCCA